MAGAIRYPPPDAAEQVAALPRRTAHAAYALIACCADDKGPVRASDVVLYDREAVSAVSTGCALASALRHGLADRWAPGIWVPSLHAMDLRNDLEDRFLAETAREDDRP